MIVRKLLLLIVMFCFLVGVSPAGGEEVPYLALFPFVSRDGEDDYLGYLLRDLIKIGLESTQQVSICPTYISDDLFWEAKISRSSLLIPVTLENLGKELGCSWIVTGSFRIRSLADREKILVSPRLYQVGKGEYYDLESQVFDPDELVALSLAVSASILDSFQLQAEIFIPPLEIHKLIPLYQGVAKMEEALRTYGQAQFPDKPLWQEAFSLAEKTVSQEPAYGESYFYLAKMYQKTGWLAKEVEVWNLYLGQFGQEPAFIPQISQAYLRLAYAYFQQKKNDLALESIQKVIELNPSFAEAYYLWGRIEYESGKTEEAQKLWDKAFELDPSLEEAAYFARVAQEAQIFGQEPYEAYRQGYQLFADGRLTEAEQYLKQAVQLNPQMKEAFYWLGRTLYSLGKLEEAEEAWRKVLELDPFHSQARRFLDRTVQEKNYGRLAVNAFREGYELYQEARYLEAIPYFREAVNLSPTFLDAHQYLARSYYQLGEKEKYIEEREKTIQLLSNQEEKAWQYYQIAFELFSWEEKETALEFLEKSLQVSPTTSAYLLAGSIWEEKKEWEKAADNYLAAFLASSQKEEKAQALWGAAVAKVNLEEWQEALTLLDQLVVDYPFSSFIEEAEALRIEALVREGDYQEARLSCDQFLLRFPQSSFQEKVQFWQAASWYSEELWNEAAQALRGFLDKFPQSAYQKQALEMLGYSYRNQGKEEEAREIFSRLGGEEGSFLEADTFYRQGNWEEAKQRFRSYLEKYPVGNFSLEAKLKLASCLIETNSPDEAEKVIAGSETQLKELFPEDFLRLQAKLYFQKEDWGKVIAALKDLEGRVGSLERDYLLILTWAYFNSGEEELARELLLQAGENPDEVLTDPVKGLIEEALLLVERGSYPLALEKLEEAEKQTLTPEQAEIITFLQGKVYYFTGETEKAFSYLQTVWNREESEFRSEVSFYLGQIAFNQEDWESAVQFYSQLGENPPKEIMWNLARAYHYLSRPEKSIFWLHKLQGDPTFDEEASLLLLEELYSQKDFSSFLEQASLFIDKYPDHNRREELIYLSVWSAYFLKNWDKTIELINSYRDNFPQGEKIEELTSLLADVYITQGDYYSAIQTLRGIENGVEKEYTWYRLGSLYFKLEDFSQAIPYLEKVFEQASTDYYTQAGYLLGVSWEYLGETDKALEVYQTLAGGEQKDQWTAMANERLNLLTN
ncbi:MAG: hypothetical protein PWP04_1110 [Candidatus Atribacteria bacterium]|nr:hypothetical protein [Candidatus Atribacteria bacterium]